MDLWPRSNTDHSSSENLTFGNPSHAKFTFSIDQTLIFRALKTSLLITPLTPNWLFALIKHRYVELQKPYFLHSLSGQIDFWHRSDTDMLSSKNLTFDHPSCAKWTSGLDQAFIFWGLKPNLLSPLSCQIDRWHRSSIDMWSSNNLTFDYPSHAKLTFSFDQTLIFRAPETLLLITLLTPNGLLASITHWSFELWNLTSDHPSHAKWIFGLDQPLVFPPPPCPPPHPPPPPPPPPPLWRVSFSPRGGFGAKIRALWGVPHDRRRHLKKNTILVKKNSSKWSSILSIKLNFPPPPSCFLSDGFHCHPWGGFWCQNKTLVGGTTWSKATPKQNTVFVKKNGSKRSPMFSIKLDFPPPPPPPPPPSFPTVFLSTLGALVPE